GHIDANTENVSSVNGKQRGSTVRVGRNKAPDIDQAASDHAIKWRGDLLEVSQLSQPVHRRLLNHHVGPRDRKCRGSRGEGQPVLITLLRTRHALDNELRSARACNTAKFSIGLGLLDRGPQLDKLCLRLVELLVEIWRRNDSKHIPFSHLAADIHIANTDIARGAGK